MKSPITALVLAFGLASSLAGDSLFTSNSLGRSILQANDRLARTWFLEVTGGPVAGVSGDLARANDEFPGISLYSQDFEGLYGNAWLLGFRFGKHLGVYDAYFRFAYTQADGRQDQIGTSGGTDIQAIFSDYTDFALLGGVRREFLQPSRLHPYLGFETGVRFVDGIEMDVLELGTLPIYDDSAVFSAEVTAGISYDLTDAFRIGLETGLRFQGSLEQIDGTVLENYNSSDSLLFVPILLTGTLNF